eukprot:283112-Prorocentrum_minimum.AAC.4
MPRKSTALYEVAAELILGAPASASALSLLKDSLEGDREAALVVDSKIQEAEHVLSELLGQAYYALCEHNVPSIHTTALRLLRLLNAVQAGRDLISGPLDAGPSHEEPPLRNLLARLARVRLQTLKPDDVRAAATSRACCLRVTARAGAPRHATVRFDTSIEATAACPKQSEVNGLTTDRWHAGRLSTHQASCTEQGMQSRTPLLQAEVTISTEHASHYAHPSGTLESCTPVRLRATLHAHTHGAHTRALGLNRH